MIILLKQVNWTSAGGGQGFRLLWGRFSQSAGFSLDLKPRKPRVFKVARAVCWKVTSQHHFHSWLHSCPPPALIVV